MIFQTQQHFCYINHLNFTLFNTNILYFFHVSLENNQPRFLFLSSSCKSIGVVAYLGEVLSFAIKGLTGPIQVLRFLRTGKVTYLGENEPPPKQFSNGTCETSQHQKLTIMAQKAREILKNYSSF